MFAVLKINAPKKRNFLVKKIFKNQHATHVITEQVDKITYFTIESQTEDNKINWTKIHDVAGRESSRLLIPQGLSPPKNSGVKPYAADKYLQKVLTNTAFEIVKRSNLPKQDMTLCLYDYYGKCPEVALSLLKFASTVKIFTAQYNIYNYYNSTAKTEYGAMFLISERPPSGTTFDLLLAPYGICDRPLPPYDTPAFYLHDTRNKFTITDDCINLPDSLKKCLPAGIPSAIFAAALYERANLSFLGQKTASFLMNNQQKVSTLNINIT